MWLGWNPLLGVTCGFCLLLLFLVLVIYLFIYFFIIYLFVSISELMRLFAGEHFGEHFSKWIHPSLKEFGYFLKSA